MSVRIVIMIMKGWSIDLIKICIILTFQVLKDCNLVGATIALTGVTLFLLLLETAIPQLRGKITQEVDQENPSGMTVSELLLVT